MNYVYIATKTVKVLKISEELAVLYMWLKLDYYFLLLFMILFPFRKTAYGSTFLEDQNDILLKIHTQYVLKIKENLPS